MTDFKEKAFIHKRLQILFYCPVCIIMSTNECETNAQLHHMFENKFAFVKKGLDFCEIVG